MDQPTEELISGKIFNLVFFFFTNCFSFFFQFKGAQKEVVDKLKAHAHDKTTSKDPNHVHKEKKATTNPDNRVLKEGAFTFHALDASVIDVYKGAHALIIMIDPVKKSTWAYAKSEIAKAPKDLDILLVVSLKK